MVNQNKKTQVDSLISVLNKSSNLFLVKIDKTSHQNLEALRKELKKAGGKIKVIKNTFFEKAVNKLSAENKSFLDLKNKFFPLKETSAIVSLEKNWDSGLKAFYEFTKKEKTLSFKLALLDNTVYNNSEVERIAMLPGRDQLIASVIGSLKAPMSKFVYALKFNTNKFVYILKQKSTN
ncbi:MAG: 50S ribosomal protein L10 [Candidatus Roizmanbacteria bacterium GW2011_GWA2_35_19]|uniref:Large ribosomal subunit protein uL10 n=2 Tax=Candidatus Roizmaniibacteriota TaxID=1752723 RepID=A0A0G0E8J8_9BACT|nr:MAG: 50S ribosomal protein L10 [Candidatus Roizmanbacteria bacterium GW2011_GWC2_35_12]KKP71645.1 MAG: 50S ribosomal protein L10 [Candidatus Roizmanbacteria bacterium GW2011_GWA2_35_19]